MSILKLSIIFSFLLLFSATSLASLTAYPASCMAGQECNVYYKFDTVLADYKCVIDVIGGAETIRVYANPSSSKLTDEKSISTVATKSIGKMMFAKLPRLMEGQYAVNIECGDGKTTEAALSSVKIESPKMEISGTQYEVGTQMKIFTQIADGDEYNNGSCVLSMYYPNNAKLINNELMTPLGENGLYFHNTSVAPSTLGIYMTSVKCTFPDDILDSFTCQYNQTEGYDSYVDSSGGNTNYGTSIELRVQKSAPRQISYITPCLLPIIETNNTILGATLYLFRMAGSSTTPVDIFPVTSAWTESLVTWNTQPTISRFSCTNSVPTTVQAIEGWYSWDMTRCIQNFSNGQNTTPYFGFAINATTTSGNQRFYSSDYVGWQLGPKLVVTYSKDQNVSFYSRAITEIQVVPATFNGTIDLTELGDLVNQTNYETHLICLESGVCIDDPKFYDYRRDFITTSSLTDYLNFSNVAAIVSLGLLLLIYISVRHNKRNGYKFVQHGGYREA